MVTTRSARAEDAPPVAALVAQLGYDSTSDEVVQRLARVLARFDQQFIVAESAGRLVPRVEPDAR